MMEKRLRHDGRVVVITGSSEGIGRGIARMFAQDGAAVVIHGLASAAVDDAVDEITALGGRATGFVGDVSDAQTHSDLARVALEAYGRIDHLATSAGIQTYGDVVTTTAEDFDRVYAVNVRGVFLSIQACISEIRRNRGTVSLISSVQGIATQNNVLAYTTSKGALNAMARALAVDEAEHGVRVNAVLPGSVDTPMLRKSAGEWSDGTPEGVDRVLADWGQVHALGRIGQPDEIGALCSFLASEEASFITGGEIRADGGLLARIAASLPLKDAN
jgi:NAD(P)-dependent dehydrogenase (short-subunit alcohol dehydrogenase family)